MSKQTKKIVYLLLFILLMTIARFTLIGDALSFENVKKSRAALELFVQDHYLLSVAIFSTAYILITALSIPGATIMTLAGGFLYGAVLTTVYVNIAATAGAALAFLAARYLLGEWLQAKYRGQLRTFNEEISRNGSRYLLMLRLAPIFPFFLINILSGFTTVRLKTFIWTTMVGIIPGTAVYAYAGQQIGSIDSPEDVLSGPTLSAFTILALFALLPVMIQRMKTAKQR